MNRLSFFYHLRNLKYAKRYWSNHFEGVRQLIKAWNPKRSDELLLFGPSAGYSLPLDFVQRFKSVTAVEPDPIARILFENRFKIKPKWIKHKINFGKAKDLEPFKDFKGTLLFCNVLGQIPIQSASPIKKVLRPFLEGKTWASFHDAMSGNGIEFDCEDAPKKKASLSEMKSWIYVMRAKENQVHVNAHLAPDLFDASPELHFRYWWWKITGNQSHLIEGVYHE